MTPSPLPLRSAYRACLLVALASVAILAAPGALLGQVACPQASGEDAEAGWAAYRAGDMEGARTRFRAALARCPDDAYATTGLGYVALREGEVERARALFDRVVAVRPDDVDALVGLGIAAWRAGEREEALRRFRRVEELVPDHATAAEYLGRLKSASLQDWADVAWRAGDVERALGLYAARLEADSTDGGALHRVALGRAWAGAYDVALDLLERLLRLEPGNDEARVDRARVRAWSGDITEAIRDLDELLSRRPGWVPALEARATFGAWAGRYDEALETLTGLLDATPGSVELRRQRAQVLSWASDLEASRAAFDSLLAVDPSDTDARLGLGRVLTFAGDFRGAVDAYQVVLDADARDVRALFGLGRALTWEGRLVQGEDALRRAVAASPLDVSALVGLGQNLRWQGRHAAALRVLEEARRLDPTDGDVREQRRWVDAALAPQVRPSVVVERDSDQNRMLTVSTVASVHPVPRLTVRADVYRRSMEVGPLERRSQGLIVSGSWQAEPGWTLAVGAGGSRSDGSGASSFASWTVGATSPRRNPLVGALRASSSALDVTAPLVERGVRLTEVSVAATWLLRPRWEVEGALGQGTFKGLDDNRRTNVAVVLSHDVAAAWRVGAGVRYFGFEKDLQEGYFDPDFFGVAEVSARWLHEPGRWLAGLELAPAVQKVTREGELRAAVRASARLGFRLGPGRELVLSGGFSSTGLQSFASGGSDYRYRALGVGGSWVF